MPYCHYEWRTKYSIYDISHTVSADLSCFIYFWLILHIRKTTATAKECLKGNNPENKRTQLRGNGFYYCLGYLNEKNKYTVNKDSIWRTVNRFHGFVAFMCRWNECRIDRKGFRVMVRSQSGRLHDKPNPLHDTPLCLWPISQGWVSPIKCSERVVTSGVRRYRNDNNDTILTQSTTAVWTCATL